MTSFCRSMSIALILATAALARGAETKESVLLQAHREPGTLDRVETQFEVGGDLKVANQAKDGNTPVTVKMSAVAQLTYDEKMLNVAEQAGQPLRSARYYERSTAVVKVGEDGAGVKPELRPERRLLAVEAAPPKIVVFCPAGTLTWEELELVDLAGNTLLLDQLLPGKQAAVGDSWPHGKDLIAALCGLDEATKTDAASTLTEITPQYAKMTLSGNVEGSKLGQQAKIQLKAKYRFDRQTRRIDWIGLVLQEQREVGLLEPGCDVVAKVQTTIVAAEKSPQLTDAALAGLSLTPSADLRRLRYVAPEKSWSLTHDRRWGVVTEKGDTAVLRLVDQGTVLAQCRVSVATDAKAKEMSLSDYQEEIRQALGKSFRELVRVGQGQNEAGYRVFRVEARGESGSATVRWIYYLVVRPDGRRAVAAFSIEESLVERFAAADQDLIDTLRFE